MHAGGVQHIVESFRQGLQLHLNQKYAQEVMALQNFESPKFSGQNDIWM